MIRSVSIVAALALLAACDAKREDAAAESVEQAYDNQADRIDAGARNINNDNLRDALEDQADAVRAEGEAKADAIEDANVNSLTSVEVGAAANGTR